MTASAYETNVGGIRYRIRPSLLPPKDGVTTWLMEYLQDPKHRPDDWSPRGAVSEIDGKFDWLGVLYNSPAEALHARLHQGP